MKQQFLTQLLLFLLPVCGATQAITLQGQVLGDGEGLAYAVIAVNDGETGTTTDEDGYFELTNLPSDSIQLTASYVGFSPKSQVIFVGDQPITSITFHLESTVAHLEQVVITGTMKPTFVSDSPVKIDVITARQLETFLPSAGASIVENVSLVNGVQEVVACGVCFTNSISINGLPGPYTAVLMDGMPIYGNLASVYGLNGIPNMIIDRFEIIKGPSSTLYGSEAVAGVINIITKDPADQPRYSIDLMGTSHQEVFGNLAFSPSIGRSNGYIGLNFAYMDEFDDANGDSFSDAIHLDRYSLFTKWNIHRASGKQFTLAGKYYYEDRRNGVEAFLRDRAYRNLRGDEAIYGESIYTERWELFGRYELPTALPLRLDFSFSHHDQDSYYGSDNYLAEQTIGFGNLLWDNLIGKHDLLVGLTARYQYYDDNTVATANENTNEADRQVITGIFVQDEWVPTKALTILGGLRMDHYHQHGLIFAPRLNVKYKPGTYTTLRANFGTGFRVVNLFTEDHAFVTGQRSVEILGKLNPEQSYNGTFNVHHLYLLGDGQGTIDIDAYYTYFTNKIIPNYDTPGQIIYANSNGFAETRGIGISINHEFPFPLAFNAGINLQRSTQTEPDDMGTEHTSAIEFAPDWTGIFTANYTWGKTGFQFAYTINLTGPMALPEVFDLDEMGNPLPTARPTSSDAFALHNFQVRKRFSDGFSIYAGVQNLTNFTQPYSPLIGYNDPNAPVGFSSFFDTAYAYGPTHQREVYLGFKWDFGQK